MRIYTYNTVSVFRVSINININMYIYIYIYYTAKQLEVVLNPRSTPRRPRPSVWAGGAPCRAGGRLQGTSGQSSMGSKGTKTVT